MVNLPILWDDKENSPELLAFLQQYGEKAYVSAENINQIKAGVNWLYNNVAGGKGITRNTGFSLVGENCVFNAEFSWRINGQDFVLDADLEIPVPYAAPGNHRIDLIVTDGATLIRIPGTEVDELSSYAEPIYDQNTQIRVTAIPVTDNALGTPEEVIDLTPYQTKLERASTDVNNAEWPNIAEQGYYNIVTSASGVVRGMFQVVSLTGPNYLYNGKAVVLKNATTNPITLKHLDTTQVFANYKKFFFPTATDLVLQPNESASFAYVNGRFELVCVNNIVKAADLISQDANNTAVLGGDNKIFVPVNNSSTDTFTLTFNTGNKAWVPNTWYQQFASLGFNITGNTTYGTGVIPTVAFTQNASFLPIPNGYVLAGVIAVIASTSSAFDVPNSKEIYITRGTMVYDSNSQLDIEILVQETFNYTPSGSAHRYFKDLTVSTQTSKNNQILQVGIRELANNNTQNNIYLKLTFKKS